MPADHDDFQHYGVQMQHLPQQQQSNSIYYPQQPMRTQDDEYNDDANCSADTPYRFHESYGYDFQSGGAKGNGGYNNL